MIKKSEETFPKYAIIAFPNPTSGLEYVSLEGLLAESDVVSLHCPLLPTTHHMLNAGTLKKMKRGVVIINTSRGGLIDSEALLAALRDGSIGGAGLDVYEEESEWFYEDRSDAPGRIQRRPDLRHGAVRRG